MTPEPLWISSVTISVPNPRESAQFYADLLGWRITALESPRPGEPAEAGWAQVGAPEGTQGLMRINLEYEREYVRPVWPSMPGMQHITVHLDLPVADLEAAQARAINAGAVLAEHQPQPDVRVMVDPAGQPFCLFQA